MTNPVVALRSGLNPPRAPAPSDTGATFKKKTKTQPSRVPSLLRWHGAE